MKIKKQLALCTALWILCTAFSACGKVKLEVPEDTTAIEKFVEETSAEITADNTAVTNADNFDKAIKLAEKIAADGGCFMLYDLDFDGIPELLEETGFIYTAGWNVYKLTGDEPLNIGCMNFVPYEETSYTFMNGISLDGGLHIYRDVENDTVFYVSKNPYELHSDGFCEGVRYDVYSDTISEKIIYSCKWYNSIDENGKFIYYNAIDGQQATPFYRIDVNSDEFRYYNEFEEYLSQYEYLGTLDNTNTFDTRDGGNFLEYAEQFRSLPKLKDEQVYADKTEYVTVCGTEYDINSYSASITITENNFDTIDLRELKKLPKLELLTISNSTDNEIDITPLNELEKLRWLNIKGDYAEEKLKDFDRLEYLSAAVTIEILPEMDSLKCVDVSCCTGSLSILSDMEQLEAVRYSCLQKENGEIDALAENLPDLLLIYVP